MATPKTMRARRASQTTRRNSLPTQTVTINSISKWYTHLFDKLGWMVLAKKNGCAYKISDYKKSINHLLKAIEHLMDEYKNHNRKYDLNVMLKTTMVLRDFVTKHL